MTVFESLVDASDESSMQWHQIPWCLASEEAERIGIEHVAQMSTYASSSKSQLSKQISAQLGAVAMLHSRLKLIHDYLSVVVYYFFFVWVLIPHWANRKYFQGGGDIWNSRKSINGYQPLNWLLHFNAFCLIIQLLLSSFTWIILLRILSKFIGLRLFIHVILCTVFCILFVCVSVKIISVSSFFETKNGISQNRWKRSSRICDCRYVCVCK